MSSFRLTYLSLPLLVCLAFATAGCGAPPLIVGASYAADGGLLAASSKTSTDHLVSMVSKKDCAMWRVFRSRPICTEREDGHDPYAVDYAQPQRMVAEDGVHYVAPLRSGPDVPAMSWDPAAYASAPLPGTATSPTELPAAVADPTPLPLPAPKPAAVLPAAVADTKPTPPASKPATAVKKAKPTKKASRGQAASGS